MPRLRGSVKSVWLSTRRRRRARVSRRPSLSSRWMSSHGVRLKTLTLAIYETMANPDVDDETSMKELEEGVRKIEKDGLVWGASKLVPLGFGIKKLQINLVVEDEKISLDELQAEIEEDEDHVQSTDIAAMQKL